MRGFGSRLSAWLICLLKRKEPLSRLRLVALGSIYVANILKFSGVRKFFGSLLTRGTGGNRHPGCVGMGVSLKIFLYYFSSGSILSFRGGQ